MSRSTCTSGGWPVTLILSASVTRPEATTSTGYGISLAEVTSGGTKRSRAERPACGAQNNAMPSTSAAGAVGFDFILIFMLFDSRRFHLGALGHSVAMIGTFDWAQTK